MLNNPAYFLLTQHRRAEDAYSLAKDELRDAKRYLGYDTPETRSIAADELRHAEYWIGMIVDPAQRQKLQTWHDEMRTELTGAPVVMMIAANGARRSYCEGD